MLLEKQEVLFSFLKSSTCSTRLLTIIGRFGAPSLEAPCEP